MPRKKLKSRSNVERRVNFLRLSDWNVAKRLRVSPTSERARLANAPVLVTVNAVDGSVELVAEAEVGYHLTSLDEIRIKRPSLEPLR